MMNVTCYLPAAIMFRSLHTRAQTHTHAQARASSDTNVEDLVCHRRLENKIGHVTVSTAAGLAHLAVGVLSVLRTVKQPLSIGQSTVHVDVDTNAPVAGYTDDR